LHEALALFCVSDQFCSFVLPTNEDVPMTRRFAVTATLATSVLCAPALASTCFGTTSAGRIEGAVALPLEGANFIAYTELGLKMGRTYVHTQVRDVVLDAYAVLVRNTPGVRYVYGETGLRTGGSMPPHRTHENGTSVDFMVPVRGQDGLPATLPRSANNRYGYDLDFDSAGTLDELRIDFTAIAEHLEQLDLAARRRGLGIARVILDPDLTQHVLATPAGARIKSLPFMKTKPWVRHDEHYHVDFAVKCSR
jgi:penicillin-insensitive murein endopeptidase